MWMDDIITYLRYRTLPSNKLQAHQVQYRATKFCLLNGTLYKQSFLGPLLRCLQPKKVEYVLREIHKDIYKNHSVARSMVRKVVCQGYFWPQMERDATSYTRKCDKCQRFALVSHLPYTVMVPMTVYGHFPSGESIYLNLCLKLHCKGHS